MAHIYDNCPTWQFSPNIELLAPAATATIFNPTTTQRSLGTIHIHHIIDISNYNTLSRLLGSQLICADLSLTYRRQQQERLTPCPDHMGEAMSRGNILQGDSKPYLSITN